jgi:hypothetical protein
MERQTEIKIQKQHAKNYLKILNRQQNEGNLSMAYNTGTVPVSLQLKENFC